MYLQKNVLFALFFILGQDHKKEASFLERTTREGKMGFPFFAMGKLRHHIKRIIEQMIDQMYTNDLYVNVHERVRNPQDS